MTLPYKYRGIAMLAMLVLVLPAVSWQWALRDTFAAWRDCRRLTARLETIPATGTARVRASDFGRESIRSGGLLDTLRRYAAVHEVEILGYEPVVTEQHDGVALHSAQLLLTGDFKALLQTVAVLERTLSDCRMHTLVWQTATDRRTRHTKLTLTLYIQQIVLKD